MENKDIIKVKTSDGIEEEVELILSVDKNDKKYILYRNKDNEIYASYLLKSDDLLHNDLTDEEYEMLETIYKKGVSLYDSKK